MYGKKYMENRELKKGKKILEGTMNHTWTNGQRWLIEQTTTKR